MSGQSLSAICLICSHPSAPHKHYGAICCYSCRIFFRRGVGKVFKCIRGIGDCPVDQFTRTNCKKCRFQKCLQVGMVPALVDSFVRIKPFVINDVGDISANPKQVKVIQMKEKPDRFSAEDRRLAVKSHLAAVRPHLTAAKPNLTALCGICGQPAAPHKHYGAICCYSCRIFFRRGVGKSFRCIGDGGNCALTAKNNAEVKNWNNCKKCRYDKCLAVGMIPGLVDSFTRMKQQEKNVAKEQMVGQLVENVKKEEPLGNKEMRDPFENKQYNNEEAQDNVDGNKKAVLLQLRDIFPVGNHLDHGLHAPQSSENINPFVPSRLSSNSFIDHSNFSTENSAENYR